MTLMGESTASTPVATMSRGFRVPALASLWSSGEIMFPGAKTESVPVARTPRGSTDRGRLFAFAAAR
jgi:hypothetical protein